MSEDPASWFSHLMANPPRPKRGSIWHDTDDNVVRVYDGDKWVEGTDAFYILAEVVARLQDRVRELESR